MAVSIRPSAPVTKYFGPIRAHTQKETGHASVKLGKKSSVDESMTIETHPREMRVFFVLSFQRKTSKEKKKHSKTQSTLTDPRKRTSRVKSSKTIEKLGKTQ